MTDDKVNNTPQGSLRQTVSNSDRKGHIRWCPYWCVINDRLMWAASSLWCVCYTCVSNNFFTIDLNRQAIKAKCFTVVMERDFQDSINKWNYTTEKRYQSRLKSNQILTNLAENIIRLTCQWQFWVLSQTTSFITSVRRPHSLFLQIPDLQLHVMLCCLSCQPSIQTPILNTSTQFPILPLFLFVWELFWGRGGGGGGGGGGGFFFWVPSHISWVHHFWWDFWVCERFFNSTLEVVPFCLPGWCMPVCFCCWHYLSRTWMSGSFESVWWNVCVHRTPQFILSSERGSSRGGWAGGLGQCKDFTI